MVRNLFTFTLIFFAALSRLIPHPPNVAPITALALFGAVYLDKKHTFLVPIIAMLVSDYIIGFHSAMIWVYGSFILIGFFGLWLRQHQGIRNTIGASVFGSIIFFIITNFGVWISSQPMYSHDLSGLVQCYTAAIPFFRNSLIGDLFYVSVLFGIYEITKRFLPVIRFNNIMK